MRPKLSRRRGALIATLIAAVGIGLLAVAAVLSWHFSSQVLVPDHARWSEEVSVEAVAPRSIRLARSDAAVRPGFYGLTWESGHAIVGPVLSENRDTVTRRLRNVRGYLVPGVNVGLESDVFSGNPREARGLPFKAVDVDGELGPMPAWLIPGRARTWAIVVHGINGDPQIGLRIAPTLHRLSLPTLLITYREDLGAPPSPDGYHHMGLTEWRDLEAAAHYALAHGARRLILVGYSMGGSLVTQFMQESPFAARVTALVLDAPALDWKAILEFNSERMGLPGFLATPVEWAIDTRIDADWKEQDAIDHPQDFHLPILLFHGLDDKVVPIGTSEEFAAELPRWVTFYRVPRAGHVQSWNVNPVLYQRRMRSFLEAALETDRARPRGSGSTR